VEKGREERRREMKGGGERREGNFEGLNPQSIWRMD